jgi:hypothetical protein
LTAATSLVAAAANASSITVSAGKLDISAAGVSVWQTTGSNALSVISGAQLNLTAATALVASAVDASSITVSAGKLDISAAGVSVWQTTGANALSVISGAQLNLTATAALVASAANASSITVSAGKLDISAAGASLWKTTSGNLSVEAAAQLNLKGATQATLESTSGIVFVKASEGPFNIQGISSAPTASTVHTAGVDHHLNLYADDGDMLIDVNTSGRKITYRTPTDVSEFFVPVAAAAGDHVKLTFDTSSVAWIFQYDIDTTTSTNMIRAAYVYDASTLLKAEEYSNGYQEQGIGTRVTSTTATLDSPTTNASNGLLRIIVLKGSFLSWTTVPHA